jgi:putative MATE family efflux protein
MAPRTSAPTSAEVLDGGAAGEVLCLLVAPAGAGALSLSRERFNRILTLALPIIGGMVSQNVMNLVDTAMVGQLGKEALAAVGLASFVTFLSQAFLTGLGSGVQAMAARRLGEGREHESALGLNASLVLSLLIGLPIAVTLFSLAPTLFPYLIDDAAVVEHGVPYWRARLFAVVAVGMNFSFRGFWNGVNLSKLYMRTLVVMHICNIGLNYVLIFGKLGLPALGAEGAGIGTAIATWLGCLTYTVLGLTHARKMGFLRGLPERAVFRRILKLSVPTGIQQMFFSGGLVSLFWIIGKVGTAELAAANVLINIMLVAILPGLGFGMASASLVGQALGAGDAEDARRWAWDVAKVGAVAMAALGLPMVLIPEHVLNIFVDASEAKAVLDVGALPLRIFGLTVAVEGVRTILQFSLIGAGDTTRVMITSVAFQWLVMLPAAYVVGPVLTWGLLGIWGVMIAHNFLVASVYTVMWQRGSWQSIRV